MKLRTQLALLALVALLPVAFLAAVLGGSLIRQERDTFRRGAEDRVHALITAVDSELKGSVDVLRALANVRSLDEQDLPFFRETAAQILAAQANWTTINLARADGQQIVNLRASEGVPLPRLPASEESFARVVSTMNSAVGDLVVGPVTRRWDFAVRVPVVRNGRLDYILSAVVDPDSILTLVATQGLPADWEGMVIDRNGRIVARTVEPESSVARLASEDLRQALHRSAGGWYRGSNLEGAARYWAYRVSDSSGWTFAMAIPTPAVDATANRATWMFGFTLTTAILLAFALAQLFSRRISEPIAALAAATDRLAAGEPVEIKKASRLGELRSLETALRHAAGAQIALRHAEEQTRSIVDHVLDGIITIDENGAIESFNPAAESLFGYSPAEVIGKNVKLLMPEPYRGAHDSYIDNYIGTGQAKVIGIGREVSGQRKDGSTFPMSLAVSEFWQGKRRFFTGIVRDITERKRAEQALKDADRHKDEFLAMLSHELRNPLATLSMAAHVLRTVAPDNPKIADAQGVIERQTQHMVRLIEDLLDITRVRLGKLSLQRERLDLAALIADVTRSRRVAGGFAARASVSLDLSPVWVYGDKARLEQVYSNLLGNAFKFTPASGSIRVSVKRDGNEAVLRVADDGKGIAVEVLPAVFELFVQGEQNVGRAEGGLGLGLALVRRLAEMHGGKVGAASAGVGFGATFTVSLPAIEEPRDMAANVA